MTPLRDPLKLGGQFDPVGATRLRGSLRPGPPDRVDVLPGGGDLHGVLLFSGQEPRDQRGLVCWWRRRDLPEGDLDTERRPLGPVPLQVEAPASVASEELVAEVPVNPLGDCDAPVPGVDYLGRAGHDAFRSKTPGQ